MINKLQKSISETQEIQPNQPKKIFFKRNSGSRNIENQDALESLLHQHGFTTIAPESLDFCEQVQLLSHAEAVVGATGAAMANLIFCPSAAKIIVMIAYQTPSIYEYWRNMAAATGKSMTYVLGTPKFRTSNLHGDYVVEPEHLKAALVEAGL